MDNNSTIVAPATNPVNSAISVIRLSGDKAVEISDKIFSKDLNSSQDRKMIFGKIINSNNAVIDEGLAVKMCAPHSYTGEDTVEFYVHGGKTVTECIIRELITNGARLAQKGEFTKRAFLNGKMDLTQAESVIDIINSQTENSLLMAQNNLNGKLRRKVDGIRSKVMNVIMKIMAGNDFPDETGDDISSEIYTEILEIESETEALIKSYDKGKIIRDGFTCAICGRPNVGKSSLLNAILDEDRAIVTDIEGTTRDVVTERINIGNYIMNIADTAGLRESNDTVEKLGIEKSYKYMKNVDLVLYVIDSTKGITKEEQNEIDRLNNPYIIVYNKTDIQNDSSIRVPNSIGISAKNKDGINVLIERINKIIEERLTQCTSDETISSQRHFDCLCEALKYLIKAKETLINNFEPDIASIDLENCAMSLGEITGTTVNDEVIDNIFKNFCIGK